ncbi:MAG: SdrD B-like domain-containing protein, partial [Gallionellaceae bacterium]|nr:SdrD B-like domain-containing protein [Gallionellaceae bacterium]
MPQAPVVTIKVTYPGSIPDPSYFDLQFINNALFGSGNYDTWCADRDISIDLYSQGNGFYSSTVSASIYSTYEIPILSATIPTITNTGNFDLVNWLLNQNFSASGNGYTFGEVQAAVWTLLGDDYTSSTLIGTPDPVKINTLVALASQHDGYVPDITDSDPTNDKIAVLLFPHKADGTAQQPILIRVDSAALGDYVWADGNANGAQDVGEYGVQGVTVNLWRDLNDNLAVDANEILATTTTDASGYYKFFGLTPGLQYQLQFIKPANYSGFTLQDATGDTLDSDANSSGITAAVTLAPGEFNTSIDAGLVQKAHIGDFIWEDKNANGQQDVGETGIAGVTVQLKDAGGNVVQTTVTGANGGYGFDVLPGTYSVQVVAPAG